MGGCVSRLRLARLRAVLAAQAVDAFLVRDTSNIQWLTAFDNVFDAESAHALYVDDERAVLHTDSRYVTACEAAAQGGPVSVNAERVSHAQFVAGMRRAAESAGYLGIEDSMTLAEFRKLKEVLLAAEGSSGSERGQGERQEVGQEPAPASAVVLRSPLRETSGLVLGLRTAKDADEVRRMKAAQAITDAAFAHIVGFMRPGMTEREVQLELESFMLRKGASGLAFSSIVATGANGANPHAIPGDMRLEAGQCVVMDFGARALGYCSDMTRVVFVGEPDARLRDAYAVLRRANEQVEAMLRPGVTGAEAHELAERILEEGSFGSKMGHGLGHGVGIDIHEEPVLAPRNKQPLEVGNVVTVEPGIYLPGEFGMRLEDFGVITETGFEVFTQSTHDMVIV